MRKWLRRISDKIIEFGILRYKVYKDKWPWTGDEIHQWLLRDDVLTKDVKWRQLDGKYFLCSKEVMEQIASFAWQKFLPYRKEKFDCDDFAFLFKSWVNLVYGLNNVGLVIDDSTSHAYNIVVTNDGYLRVFEPQTGKWHELGTGLYKLEKGLVLL